jgi:hypothetical protein
VVEALSQVGIHTFESQSTRRFCYHDRSPRVSSPGSWGTCGRGSYLGNAKYVSWVDGYFASGVDSGFGGHPQVQHMKRMGACVSSHDLQPNMGSDHEASSTASIRGTVFLVPSNTAKVPLLARLRVCL